MIPLKLDDNGTPTPLLKLGGTTVVVTSTGASAASAAAISATEDIICRISASADCFITSAASPTATTSDIPLWAKTTEYFIIPKGHKVAVVQAASIYITPMSS